MWIENREISSRWKNETPAPKSIPISERNARIRAIRKEERRMTPEEEAQLRKQFEDFLDGIPEKKDDGVNERQKSLWYTRPMIDQIEKAGYNVDDEGVIRNPNTEQVGNYTLPAMIQYKEWGTSNMIYFGSQDRIVSVEDLWDGWIKITRGNSPEKRREYIIPKLPMKQ